MLDAVTIVVSCRANHRSIEHVDGGFGTLSGRFSSFAASLRCFRTELSQGSHAGEVVGCHREHEHLIDFLQSPYHHLVHVADGLGPAKALLDELSLLLRDAVALRVGDLIRYR